MLPQPPRPLPSLSCSPVTAPHLLLTCLLPLPQHPPGPSDLRSQVTLYVPWVWQGPGPFFKSSCVSGSHSYHNPSSQFHQVRTETCLLPGLRAPTPQPDRCMWLGIPRSPFLCSGSGWLRVTKASYLNQMPLLITAFLPRLPPICQAKPKLALGCHGNSFPHHRYLDLRAKGLGFVLSNLRDGHHGGP